MIHEQKNQYASPWTLKQRIMLLLWEYCWNILCRWTPKPANPWRLFILKLFGASIHGNPFVHQRARIQIPWNLTMHHKSCLGDRANAYSLGTIIIHDNAVVAQEAYICTGTHDFSSPQFNLITYPIIIEKDVFIGARAFIMPGVTIGNNAIIGSCSVVTKNVAPYSTVKGNPAK